DFLRRAGAVILAAPLLPALRAPGMFAKPSGADPIFVEKYRHTMGAIASISVYGDDRRLCEEAIAAAFAEMRRADALMSSHDPASALNGVNRAAGRDEMAVPHDVISVLESARRYHAATGGAFDVTVGPLLELYGFFRGGDSGTCPDDRTIAETLDGVGFGNVRIDPARSAVGLFHPRSRIDLGGIGVGHALDRAALVLRRMGIESALLNHSGDILAIGAPPEAAGWEIGIQDPEDPRGTVASFTLKDRSVSTSGNYENFIDTDRGRIGHILDPVTGRCPSRFLSVSVMADSSLAADALSTGFFAGGVELSAPAPSDAGTISVFTIRTGGGRLASDYHADVCA
ncbi:MAG TPA: FAD:protein FMN transferase, partial [Bacteroidota bacterium]|nr:FAD:protein FMN transferase [Bacteroidota bacterium]